MGRLRAALAGTASTLALLAPAALGAEPAGRRPVRPRSGSASPGSASNPCKESNATTHIASDGESSTDDPPFATRPKIDCFYVYPTVSGQPGANADLTIDPEQVAIARYQAARFSETCRVFAPMYRQLTLGSIFNPPADPVAAAKLAYSDVRAAWRDYLAHYNRGRGVVLDRPLAGQRDAPGADPQADRLAAEGPKAADLGADPGRQRPRPSGADVGGTFDHVPACRSPQQLHCVIAYSAFGAAAARQHPLREVGEPDRPGVRPARGRRATRSSATTRRRSAAARRRSRRCCAPSRSRA